MGGGISSGKKEGHPDDSSSSMALYSSMKAVGRERGTLCGGSIAVRKARKARRTKRDKSFLVGGDGNDHLGGGSVAAV